jgi:hypothetical protein
MIRGLGAYGRARFLSAYPATLRAVARCAMFVAGACAHQVPFAPQPTPSAPRKDLVAAAVPGADSIPKAPTTGRITCMAPDSGGIDTPNLWIGATDVRPTIAGVDAARSDTNVYVLLNSKLMRERPPFEKAGPILGAAFFPKLPGSERQYDIVESTNWAVIYGPSLAYNQENNVFVQTNEPDEALDTSLAQMVQAGGARIETGVAGVSAIAADVGGARRALIRAHPHELVVTQVERATEFARLLSGPSGVGARLRPGELFREVIRNPSRLLGGPIRMPPEVTELRLWIESRADCGADIHFEVDCGTPEASDRVRVDLEQQLGRVNTALLRMATGGLLSNTHIESDGPGAKLRIIASKAQVERLLALLRRLTYVE